MNPGSITRRGAIGLIGGAALGAAVGCGSSVGADDDTTRTTGGAKPQSISVGVVVPQSGPLKPLGTDMRRAWELWLEGHGNAIGGLEVVTNFADEEEGGATGVEAVGSVLGDVDVVVGIVTSTTAMGSRGLIEDAEKLVVIANAGAAELTGPGRTKYIWRTSFANAQVSLPLGQHVATKDDLRDTVFVMAPKVLAGDEAIAGFQEGLESGGGAVARTRQTTWPTAEDFQPIFAEIESSGASAVYCFYAGADAIRFVRDFEAFGLKGDFPLFASGFLTEGSVLREQGDAALGIQTSLHYATGLDNAANERFVTAYVDKYREPPTVFSVQMWDAALVLDLAVRAADDLTGEALAAALGEVGEIAESPRGTWRFVGQNPEEAFYLRQVERDANGTLVNVKVDDLGLFRQAGT